MQAITTKYIGPSNVKSSRVKATCRAGSITLWWDDALNSAANHQSAAMSLAVKFGWHGTWVGGQNIHEETVWVNVDVRKDELFTIKADERAA